MLERIEYGGPADEDRIFSTVADAVEAFEHDVGPDAAVNVAATTPEQRAQSEPSKEERG
jgi:hypothetical protein